MNDEDVLGAFLLVNNPIVLSEEEIKDVQKAIKKLQQENKELKLQLKGTTHCFDEEEHEKLKKQVEEYKDKINWYENFEVNKTIDKLRLKHNTQQKEFIEWLEAMSKMYENEYKDIDTAEHYNCVLQKYKEIIGD